MREHVGNEPQIFGLSAPSKTDFLRAERRKREKSIIQDGTNHEDKKALDPLVVPRTRAPLEVADRNHVGKGLLNAITIAAA